MKSQILADLSEAAHHLSLVTEAISDCDDYYPQDVAMAQLTGLSGCFTTLVQIASSLHNIETSMVLSKLSTKGTMQ